MAKSLVALVGLGALLAVASPALAMGSGGSAKGGGSTGSVNYTVNRSGNGNNGTFAGTFSGPDGSGVFDGNYTYKVSVTEPLAGIFVGLGLLGVRYLRRR